MDAWVPIVVPAMIAVGGGFAWLIREIVKSSKDAVAELKTDRDLWQKRALDAGWKGDT